MNPSDGKGETGGGQYTCAIYAWSKRNEEGADKTREDMRLQLRRRDAMVLTDFWHPGSSITTRVRGPVGEAMGKVQCKRDVRVFSRRGDAAGSFDDDRQTNAL
jgi:hypothetical protein